MRIFRQKTFSSWNEWIDKRIENSKKRKKELLNKRKELSEEPLTRDEQRVMDRVRKSISRSGVKLVDTDSKIGSEYISDISKLSKKKKDRLGLENNTIADKGIIIANSKSNLSDIANEYGNSTKDNISKLTAMTVKKGDSIKNHPIRNLIEETRANIKGYDEISKHMPDKETLRKARRGIFNNERILLEDAYQSALSSLKS